MKALLVGINAKFIHTNLAIRNITVYNGKEDIAFYEATINDNMDEVLEDIIGYNVDLIGLSCYLWNIEDVLYMAENIKKIRSNTVIVLGGPEVSYETEDLLRENPCVDFIVLNEGEERFRKLLKVLKGDISIDVVDGLAYRDRGKIIINPAKGYVDLNHIPFPYLDENLEHKLVYYETSRGCPFRCAFCLSSLDNDVRTANLKKVKEDMLRFTAMKVKVVKLVDRSFNCNLSRALDLLDIIRQLPGDTIFHCEINPELVNNDFVSALEGLENRLQFEVGIQSTNLNTLREISRTPNVRRSLKGIERLKATGINLHVDLIAGLPHEGFESFGNSFDDVYNLQPEEIQLGFLKLLKGTRLKKDAGKYGIVYHTRPPYEVFYTKDINYRELCILKGMARLLDKYHNTGRFDYSIEYLNKRFNRPFDFYLTFYRYCNKKGLFKIRHSLKSRYDILYDFVKSLKMDVGLFSDIIKFDFMLTSGKGAMPDCVESMENRDFLNEVKSYIYNEKWLKENLPQAVGMSGREMSKQMSCGLFRYDVPHNIKKRKKGIVFLHQGGKRHYAEFNF